METFRQFIDQPSTKRLFVVEPDQVSSKSHQISTIRYNSPNQHITAVKTLSTNITHHCQLPSRLVLKYNSKLALPLLELAACAAVFLLETLFSHAIGPLLSLSNASPSPSPCTSGPVLRAPLVLSTAMSAALRRAFCFSSASSRSRRASMRAAARLALLLEEVEDVAVRRSCVVMCGSSLLNDEDGWCWWRSWRGGGERDSLGCSGSSFVLESVGDGRLDVGLCFLITSDPEAGGVGGRARLGGGDGSGGVVSFFTLGLEASGVLGRDVVVTLPLLRRFNAVRDIDAE